MESSKRNATRSRDYGAVGPLIFFGVFLGGLAFLPALTASPNMPLEARVALAVLGAGIVVRTAWAVVITLREPAFSPGRELDGRGRLRFFSRSEHVAINLGFATVGSSAVLVMTFPQGVSPNAGRTIIAALLLGLGALMSGALLHEERKRMRRAKEDAAALLPAEGQRPPVVARERRR